MERSPFEKLINVVRRHSRLVLLLAASYVVRVALVLQGGQNFLPDEIRFVQVLRFWPLLLEGKHRDAWVVLSHVPHTGFRQITALVTPVQHVLSALTKIRPQHSLLWVSALLLALASVASIGLVYALARRVGASQDESLLAALLAAGSLTLAYHARHLLPYDTALLLILLATWLALDEKKRIASTLLTGLAAGYAFFTYLGYWTAALVPLGIAVLRGWPDGKEMVRRGLLLVPGVVLLPLLYEALMLAYDLPSYLQNMLAFSETISQGAYAEGWRIPFLFLWDAERLLVVLWMVGCGMALFYVLRRSDGWRRAALWLACVGALYLLLAVPSTGLHRFVVYGRSVKPLVPFICLAAAAGLTQGARRLQERDALPAWALSAALTLLIGLFAANLVPAFRVQFPAQVAGRVIAEHGHVCRAYTIRHVNIEHPRYVFLNPENTDFTLVNAGYFYPVRESVPPPDGELLFSVPHAVQFTLYHYNGFNAQERRVLRESNPTIMLLRNRSGECP